MVDSHEYAARLIWTGAAAGPTTTYRGYSRDYRVEIAGKPPLLGSADPMFLGDGGLLNPEELLVAALASCHLLSYLALCARHGVAVTAYADDASGTMALQGSRGRFTEVVLRPRVTIAAASSVETAIALHDAAHDECYIAASVNFPVRHAPVVMAGD